MPVQITIIGLGQTGTSVGLALAAHKDKVFVTGHDKDYSTEQRAKQLGAVDAVDHNLPASVANADLILLSIPIHQLRETLGYIAADIKKDAVVVDFSPVKAEVFTWAKELLPAHCHHVGLVPAAGPASLYGSEALHDSPRADLFTRGMFLLSAPAGTPGAAVKLVSDFVGLLGASTLLTDPLESDGLMAAAHLLPQLTSAALLNATVDQPGWMEVRKVAARAYASATSAMEEPETLEMTSMHNRENVVRSLDRLISALLELRDDIEAGNVESVAQRLKSAHAGREAWVAGREKGEWDRLNEAPVEKVGIMQRLLGAKLGKPRKKDE